MYKNYSNQPSEQKETLERSSREENCALLEEYEQSTQKGKLHDYANIRYIVNDNAHNKKHSQQNWEEQNELHNQKTLLQTQDFTSSQSETDCEERAVDSYDDQSKVKSQSTVCASSTWPIGLEKYSALILAPSEKQTTSLKTKSMIRSIIDNCTQQSVVKCNARSALTSMNCEADPSVLIAPYTRTFISSFLLLPSSFFMRGLRVGLLGVGGGALSNFIQHTFAPHLVSLELVDVEPMCFYAAIHDLGMKNISANESNSSCESTKPPLQLSVNDVDTSNDVVNQEVVNAPCNHNVVQVFITDAATFLKQKWQRLQNNSNSKQLHSSQLEELQQQQELHIGQTMHANNNAHMINSMPYDVLFVDLFCGSTMEKEVCSFEFVEHCQRCLSSQGVAAFNLPTSSKSFVKMCQSVFGSSNVYVVPVRSSSNVIVLARASVNNMSSCNASVKAKKELLTGVNYNYANFAQNWIDRFTISASRNNTATALDELVTLSHRHFYKRAKLFETKYKLTFDLSDEFPL